MRKGAPRIHPRLTLRFQTGPSARGVEDKNVFIRCDDGKLYHHTAIR